MKKLLPLVAVAALASACNVHDDDRYNNRTGQRTDVVPATVVTPGPTVVTATPSTVVREDGTYYYRADGTYVVRPTVVAQPGYVEVPGYQHKKADDALSDRTLGATRDIHGNPMYHKDADSDGNYDYVPYRGTRATRAYYYTY